MTAAHDQLDRLRGGLVVSCQAPPGSPLRDPTIMAAMATAAAEGGAVGIRAEGSDDVAAIRSAVDLPVIGIRKMVDADGRIFITPTAASAEPLLTSGLHLIALDGTTRPRPGGEQLRDLIRSIHDAGALALTDVATVRDADYAVSSAADAVGTTLSGYTADSPLSDEPDFDLLGELVARLPVPVFAEGRFWTPEQAGRALGLGAAFVVVGTAITNPVEITRRFAGAVAAGHAADSETERRR